MLKQEQQNAQQRQGLAQQELTQRNTQFGQDLDLRKQELAQRVAQANQKQAPSVTAYLADPAKPNEGISFTGTPEQLEEIKKKYQENSGSAPLVMPKPPSSVQHEVASFTVGGVTHKFYNKQDAVDYEKALKEKGIDPETIKDAPTVTDETVSGRVDPTTLKPLPDVKTHRETRKVVPRTIGDSGLPDLSGGAAPKAAPTPKDVSYLAAHPEMKDKFEARFGVGSADKYLP